ncbi:MAG: ABC transporter permease, partial [Bacteroidetes bacterium]|nr:ABC transporter permease [Bacteroidota bacterium]
MILFKSTDVVGKSIDWNWYTHHESLEITGVFQDLPLNSSEQFDYVVSFDVFETRFRERIERGQRNARTFFKLTPEADITVVQAKIQDFLTENYEIESDFPFLIPFSSYYLYNHYENGKAQGGRIIYVKLFTFLAILILIVACINFMNFSTARASTRMKEMGIKKVIGSGRAPLILQHFSEAILMNIFAGAIALCFVIGFLPEFRMMTGKEIFLNPDLSFILTVSAIIFISGLLSGIYPALYLSGFSPVLILNGKFRGTFRDKWLRKGLVVFQFSISMILIVAVLIIHQQVSFLKTKELGYNKDQIISLSTQGFDRNQRITFIEETKKLPGIVNASGITHALFGAQRSRPDLQWQGKDPETQIWFDQGSAYYDILELLEIPMLFGRTFSREFGNENNKVILNETAWKKTGLENPIGSIITMGDEEYEIIGVTEDFHYHSLHDNIRPNIFTFSEFATRIVVKIEAQHQEESLSKLGELYTQFNPGYPFEYTFHDQDYQQKYITEGRVEKLSLYFAGLAIIISCLGLLGLTTFSIEQRKREISIRKILGAPPRALFYLLSRDYLMLISVAIVLGIPLAYMFMKSWLENFAYH